MALDFPNSPTIGDEFTGGGFTWVWTGDSWDKVMASVATGGNGFSLLVGATGNTTYAFDTPQPAGAYSLTSQLGDTTFDIYLITAANANAGYTNTTALEATAEFDRVVVYGATTNDILNFDYKPSESPATSGDVVDGAAPFLTSATPATLASVDDTTTVTGGNFASDVEIVFTGQDDVDRPAKNIVRSSSTSLIVTRPDTFPVEQEPYSMTATNAGITNPSTNVNKLTDYFDAGSGIVWVTSSPLSTATLGTSYSVTLEATDADGAGVTYAVTTGTLPTGLSFASATGVISGTPTSIESQTFTVTATDTGGNISAREFVLAVGATLEYLVIAGGGGGGSYGGGGGAGGYRSSVIGESSGGGASAESALSAALATNYTVTVGAGGSGSPDDSVNGSNGSNSVFGTITSIGGGGGGRYAAAGSSGGSGGGGGGDGSFAGGTGTANQGYAGGIGSGSPRRAGGGGGAGSAGASGSSSADGGAGLVSSITGSAIARAGGGGGGAISTLAGYGQAGGGNGAIGDPSPAGSPAAPNTGGGGGGGGGNFATDGGDGGSGIVIIRYPASLNIIVGAGLSSYTLTDGTNKVTTFTAGSDNVSFEFAAVEATPVEFLIVAGGGGGGNANGGGGGGAGGYLSSISGESSGGGTSAMLSLAAFDSVNYAVTIGAGGTVSTNGNDSIFAGITAIKGGRGGDSAQLGVSGGSGGGMGREVGFTANASRGVPGQGFGGGIVTGSANAFTANGGGGAGAVGFNATSDENNTSPSGDGGAGIASSVTGTSLFRAGGGGACGYQTIRNTAGGSGVGGQGSMRDTGSTGATAGAVNTGSGGGGGGTGAFKSNGMPGGSGVVILRYPSTKTLTVGAGLTANAPVTIGANKVTVLTAGTGTVSLS